jgi:hypothetical protein
MMRFICNNGDCKHFGVEYNFVDGHDTAECGACKAVLQGEQVPDNPEIEIQVTPSETVLPLVD